jgi:hypothetical protein
VLPLLGTISLVLNTRLDIPAASFEIGLSVKTFSIKEITQKHPKTKVPQCGNPRKGKSAYDCGRQSCFFIIKYWVEIVTGHHKSALHPFSSA